MDWVNDSGQGDAVAQSDAVAQGDAVAQSDAVAQRAALLQLVTERTLEMVESRNPSPVILIDGRAGAGKSTLAAELENMLFKQGESKPRVVHMDDLYAGWHGLREGSSYMLRNILQPLASGKPARWQIFDWETGERGRAGEAGNGWREFEGGTPLIIEGCGALSRQSVELASLSIWLECNRETRRTRWRQREGDKFDAHWPIWAAQEDEFYEVEKSEALAQHRLLT